MTVLLSIFSFIFGTLIGSFLNVVILRMNTGRTLGGRSACFSCRTQLSWYELIPLFSFLLLRGRCRTCKTQISRQYFFVELLTGLFFLFLFVTLQGLLFLSPLWFGILYALFAIACASLIVIAVYDIRHKIIPSEPLALFGIIAFLVRFIGPDIGGYFRIPSLFEFIAPLLVALPFYLLWRFSRGRLMGLGDIKLIGLIILFMGPIRGLESIIWSFWIGAVIGLVLLAVRKKMNRGTEIPFAPFLVGATLLVFFGLIPFSIVQTFFSVY